MSLASKGFLVSAMMLASGCWVHGDRAGDVAPPDKLTDDELEEFAAPRCLLGWSADTRQRLKESVRSHTRAGHRALFVRAGRAYLVTDGRVFSFGPDGQAVRSIGSTWIDRWQRSMVWEDLAGYRFEQVVVLDGEEYCVSVRMENGQVWHYGFSGIPYEQLDHWKGGKVIIKTVQAGEGDPEAHAD